jgi:hypothetical protein
MSTRGARLLLGLAVAIAMTITIASAAAEAQEDSKVIAQKKMTEGAQLLDQGQPAEALQLFKDAYALTQNPRYQYNIGIACQSLGRNAEALDAFQAFLANAQGVRPQYVEDARKQIDLLRARIATVVVQAKQDGAGVLLDGRKVGQTPLGHPLSLDPGEHQFVVKKDGFDPFERFETLGPGQRLTLSVNLRLVAGPKVVTITVPSKESARPTPIYGRWWFWTAAGAVVVATVVTSVALIAKSDGPSCRGRSLCLEQE